MVDDLRRALSPVVSALEADGYEARIEHKPGVVLFRIVAGLEACADCLSPRSILEPMIVQQLRLRGFQDEVQLEYPADPS